MPDNLTAEQRSHCMARVRRYDTDIEQAVRSQLHRRGFRFRKHVRGLPGRPDVVFPRARVAVFIDGDFWHGHNFATWRADLSQFWRRKIEANIARDQRNSRALSDAGWRVLRLWKHEINSDLDGCVRRIIRAVEASRKQSGRVETRDAADAPSRPDPRTKE